MNLLLISCAKQPKTTISKEIKKETIKEVEKVRVVKTGADRTNLYLDKLKGKNIAVVANQTSMVQILETTKTNTIDSVLKQSHLVDYLYKDKNINVKKVFAPEHGFRGKADAGEKVVDGIDEKTGIPIVSLYGKNKKPSQEQLKGIDIVVFDIQDVGARFYTYISSLHYVMEACAEANIPVILLDRPNPNGHYIDGPILEKENASFIGMHPVPIVYGMTIGEYGQMINGEAWLKKGMKCDYTVIPLANYTHESVYSLPIKPSPNLPNDVSINLYPSLCFFEGTTISAGRGTEHQFQIYGAPNLKEINFSFTPVPNEGSKYPKHENKVCYGEDLRKATYLTEINLSWLIDAYKSTENKKDFFIPFIAKLAGTKELQKQIEKGLSEKEIKDSWEEGLIAFKSKRAKYLLYK